jgi:hypothetical protein
MSVEKAKQMPSFSRDGALEEEKQEKREERGLFFWNCIYFIGPLNSLPITSIYLLD